MTHQQFMLGLDLLLVIKKHNLPIDQTMSVIDKIAEEGIKILDKKVQTQGKEPN